MKQVLVFAGTTEGYEIARYLQRHQVTAEVFVATEYGRRSLEEDAYLTVRAGRLDEPAMEDVMGELCPEWVIDATHPYAVEVTENIRSACEQMSIRYLRLLRNQDKMGEQAVCVEDLEAAVSYLEGTKGNILLTTGSKELAAFTALTDYRERLFARVLSLPEVIASCAALGIEGKHLIGMQGPFSREMNEAMLRQYDCRYLVTKDTGEAGGFPDKYEAAVSCGCALVVIGRPQEEEGLSLPEMKRYLAKSLELEGHPQITLLGVGMGNEGTFTLEGRKACEEADVIIGAKRLADAAARPGQAVCYEYLSGKIAAYIQEHPEYEKVVIALSGDVGFYSGAKKLMGVLGDVKVICGISSVSYFMAKIGMSWDDAKIVSAHGRALNLVTEICHHKKVFAILGTKDGVASLAQKLEEFGMEDVLLYVGERLSYPGEKIFCKRAGELTGYLGDSLSVVCAVHPEALPRKTTHGLPDELFVRGKAPMTKEEVRAVSLAKLRLEKESICYDVGAGTGSVAVEMALRAYQGTVYAIEKKEEAVALLKENRQKFAVDNLEVVEGTAPDALEELEPPTHAFIGGSSGNLREIMKLLLEKNEKVRIVMNCITLETLSEAIGAIKELELTHSDIVQVSVARSKDVGRYHMMMGENPISIITCEK
ncbi:MAG: precorrin-6A reductase [Blautia sp.]|jgi:precorrin-6Y C5,15-methyltransferase (decarboxylating)